eukprot:maker-scaffold697_size109876-snap-gene-0.21 protein:Tk05854 transcript:maker-scaffold697_size109876-snap-gene-0.21-mRNA-1 annotation:"hypothetical protein EAI_01700"
MGHSTPGETIWQYSSDRNTGHKKPRDGPALSPLTPRIQNYRRDRQKEAIKSGTTNSTSKIDSVARILFPLSFGLFNLAYWHSYFQAQAPFDWEDHPLKGNILSQ